MATIAAASAFALVISACGSDNNSATPSSTPPTSTPAPETSAAPSSSTGTTSGSETTGGSATSGSASPSGSAIPTDDAWCDEIKAAYPDISGKSVSIYTSIVAPEDKPHIDSFVPFTDCTGVTVNYEGNKDFENQIKLRVQSGSAPDIAYIPQPGLLQTLVNDTGKVVPAPQTVIDNLAKYYDPAWAEYGSVGGKLFASPVGANVKSFVWYSPKAFATAGYKVPTTLDELKTLSDTIAATGAKPWCAGFESGTATGWPGTDWLEDFVLRTAGPDVYDQWYKHEIPFNDPKIVTALTAVGDYLQNDKYVNGGFGGPDSIATTPFGEAGLPLLTGKCWMHRQASFYAANFPAGTKVSEDGDVYAFYLPGDGTTKPVLGGGEFAAAFSDRPEVQAFQTYLSSPAWSNAKAKATPNGGWLSANKGLDTSLLANPIDKLSAEILQDPASVFRFDASDLMPSSVGAGTFWVGMTSFVRDGVDAASTLATIEASWPK
ncbi:carbohydrate ABC transporter substrate-binding protein [Nakamurella silvestris]|nr:carbohydrate ABC transporter substrate-binding protein [Nakamurella silvestris]